MSRSQRTSRPRRRLLITAGALVVGGALVLGTLAFAGWRSGRIDGLLTSGSLTGGSLTAARTVHDFGRVRMGDGILTARFPLTVRGSTMVTSIGTT